jgi:hypothetical protein
MKKVGYLGLLLVALSFVSGLHSRLTAAEAVRFATFNASLNRSEAGQLISDLSIPDDPQAQAVAEIIQRVRPDVLLINEFDFDPDGEALQLFQDNYLSTAQSDDVSGIAYPHTFIAPSNTGIFSGFDLNNDGAATADSPDDAFGFGFFEGQFGMALLSKFPIAEKDTRTFQLFLWKDMPGALLPDDPSTPEPADFYTGEELAVVRLSSKSHWDVPILIGDRAIHVLASHPTPPVFDGPEDRNGRRNHDEVRFWADYVRPETGVYIVDDSGEAGGLDPADRFVIMGDQNADPLDGDSTMDAARQLTENRKINTRNAPSSEGGTDAGERQGGTNSTHAGDPAFDSADFSDTEPGNLRVDYVLPSWQLRIADSGVFWPVADDPLFRLVEGADGAVVSSDHRLVWIDIMSFGKRGH